MSIELFGYCCVMAWLRLMMPGYTAPVFHEPGVSFVISVKMR